MGNELIAANIATATQLWNLGTVQRAFQGTPFLLVADVVNGVGESRYSALLQPGAAAGYRVTAGKTLWITRMRFHSEAVNTEFLLVSGTADAGDSQVAAPAGVASLNSRADGVECAEEALVARTVYEHDQLLQCAAALFPAVRCMTASTSLHIQVWGFEV